MAKRYLFSKSKNNAINIITIIAGIGVFAGALALFIVLSGFSGLKTFSLQFTNDIDPDLKLLPASGKVFSLSPAQTEKLQNLPGIKNFSKVIEERVLLNFENNTTPAFIKGVDTHFNKVTSTKNAVISGHWFKQDENQVVVGSTIATKLSLGIGGYGDVLKMMVPKPGKGLITNPKEAFTSINSIPVGVYSINDELNGKYVFAPLSLAKKLLGLKKNDVSAIELKLTPQADKADVTKALKTIFGPSAVVKTRIQLNDALYKMLNTENLAVYLIFTLVVIIALFNVGGAIVMAILDKRENIKTLFCLGAQPGKIKRIFFLQGALLTFVGGLAGLLIGVLIIVVQMNFGLVMITETLPYPVQLSLKNFGIVFATIMILGVMASYIGSTRVAKALK